MKFKHSIGALLLFLGMMANAQIPQTISFQGYVTNTNGDAVTGTSTLVFDLYPTSGGATSVWTETHNNVSISSGLYSVELGSIMALNISFNEPYELEVSIDGDVLPNRIGITSSAFALGAYSVFGESNVFPATGNVGIGTTSPASDFHIKVDDNNVRIKMEDMANEWDINAGDDFFITNDAGEEMLTLLGNDNVIIGNTTAGSNLEVKGGATINALSAGLGQMTVSSSGYTQLGTNGVTVSSSSPSGATISYPAIRLMEINGTTSSSPTGSATVELSGIVDENIISINVLVEYGDGAYVHPSYNSNPGFFFNFYYENGILGIESIGGDEIVSRPFRAVIIYKE